MGGRQNLKLLREILDLKQRKAKMLGYKNFSEYLLRKNMAGKPEKVSSLLEKIKKRVVKKSAEEYADFLKFISEKTGEKTKILDYGRSAYFFRLYEEEKIGYREEEVREFFPLFETLEKTFGMFGKIFGFEFERKNKKL